MIKKRKIILFSVIIFFGIILSLFYGIKTVNTETKNVKKENINASTITHQLTVNPAGGTWRGTTSNTLVDMEQNSQITIEEPTRPGYEFQYWLQRGEQFYITYNNYAFGLEQLSGESIDQLSQREVRYQLDTDLWSDYAAGTGGLRAWGGPTSEQFTDSFNQKYNTSIAYPTYSANYPQVKTNTSDTLYYPTPISPVSFFYFANYYPGNASYQMLCGCDTYFFANCCANRDQSHGRRPVVMLGNETKGSVGSTVTIGESGSKLTDIITASDYGKSINYSTTVNGVNISSWRVLLNDRKKHIYYN